MTPAGTPITGTRSPIGVGDVARRAVAAGEEDQVGAGGLEGARRLLGVGRGREHEVVAGDVRAVLFAGALDLAQDVGAAAGERADDRRLEPGRPSLVLAHLAGTR